MTRVLYWNINNFSQNKIFDTRSVPQLNESLDRFQHILQVLAQNPPDVFVIAEVYDRTPEVGYQGIPVNSGRRVGVACTVMLAAIRHVLGATWMLVPPLKVGNFGRREAVAVFYDSAALTFEGPWVWADAPAYGLPISTDPGTINSNRLRNYSPAWRAGLPNPGTNSNATFLDGVRAVPEFRRAAQWEFRDGFGNRIDFPTADDRSPYLTTFRDAAGRTIEIYSIHTSPASAPAAVHAISAIPRVAAVPANTVSLVIGDFNVDSFLMPVPYRRLRRSHAMLLDPGAPAVPARRPYCMTHLIATDLATPFNAVGVGPNATHNVYPRFGFMGGVGTFPVRHATDLGAIDNAFVAYAGGVARPARHDTTVVNTIVGTPYRAQWPAPVGVPAALTDNLAYNQEVPLPLPVGWPDTGDALAAMTEGLFQLWPGYGHIYSTSDHLGLMVTV